MTRDYYTVLGVTQASEDVVIRAAYRALMRRYHPDADASSEASQRSADINAAYAVLSDPQKRARYDGSLAAQHLIKPEPRPRSAWRRFVPGPAGWLALGTLAAALAAIAISPPIGVLPPDALSMEGRAPQKRPAASPKMASTRDAQDQARLCNDPAVEGLIRAEMVRRAALVGYADRAQLEAIGRSALFRVDAPTAKGEQGAGAAGCNAWLTVNLPPGVVVEGGRSNLNGEISFGLVKSEAGLRLAGLNGVRGLVRSLATVGAPPREPDSDVELVNPERIAVAPRVVHAGALESAGGKLVEVRSRQNVPTAPALKEPARTAPAAAGVSSRCRVLTGWADQAVCNNSNLTGLERQLSLLYDQSWNQADAAKRNALASTRDQFAGRRNSCRTESCLTSAYISRLRQVSDIMAGRVQQ